MPKLYKGRSANVLDFDSRELLLRQPGCAGMIAAIALQWSAIEALLSAAYAIIVFDDRESIDLTEHIVLESFEATIQFKAKRKLLLKAVEARLGPKAASDFSDVLKVVNGAYESRNNIVHARWSIAKEAPYDLVMRPSVMSKAKPIVYTIADFSPILGKIQRAYVSLYRYFSSKIRPQLGHSKLAKAWMEMFMAQQAQNNP